jgi:hypothetical protein
MGVEAGAVGKDLAQVVEDHDTVAQHAPALLGVAGHDAGGGVVGSGGGRALRHMTARAMGADDGLVEGAKR